MSTNVSTDFDSKKAEAFAGRFLTALNNGALCLMVSIGHRSGLFDVMSRLPPATSEELAAKAELNERYVREWLGAMVTGGVVDIDPAGNRYSLPAEHAAFLTRAAATDNLAVFAQYIAILGGVEDDIVKCFKKGGGVPYSRFPRFHEVMAEDSGQSVPSSLASHILPLVPGLTERLSNGIRMLDVGYRSFLKKSRALVHVRSAGIRRHSRRSAAAPAPLFVPSHTQNQPSTVSRIFAHSPPSGTALSATRGAVARVSPS